MSSRRSVTCTVPCRRCRDTAGQRRSNTPPTRCSNVASTWTRPTRRSDETRMVARCGSSQPRRGSPPRRCSSRRSGFSPGRSMLKPEPRRRRGPSIAPVSMCCRPTPPPRWPATTVSCWWSARPVPARRGCSPPPSTTCTPSIAPVFGVAPTAKAARVLERDTGMRADTVAKLLHEWQRPDRPPLPEFRLGTRDDTRRRRGRDAVHPGACISS